MKGWITEDPLNNNYVLVLANFINFFGIAAWFYFFTTIVSAFYPSLFGFKDSEIVLGLVGSLAVIVLNYLIIKPYITLMAYNQPFDVREIYFHLEGRLIFFPKYTWYYRFIPYYRVHFARVNDIVNELQIVRPFANIKMDYSANSFETKPPWYQWIKIVFVLFFVLFSAFVLFGMLVFGERHIIAIIAFTVMLIFSSRAFYKEVKGIKNLSINKSGISINNATTQWEHVESIKFDWNIKLRKKLLLKLKNGSEISVDIGGHSVQWQQIYNYALHFHQQHMAKPTS